MSNFPVFQRRSVVAGVITMMVALPVAVAPAPAAEPVNQPGFSVSTFNLPSATNLSYEAALDTVNRRLYVSDAQGKNVARYTPFDAAGVAGAPWEITTQASSPKVVQFSTKTNSYIRDFSFAGLLGSDGVVGGGTPFGAPAAPAPGVATVVTQSATNLQRMTAPYGLSIAPLATDNAGAVVPVVIAASTRNKKLIAYQAASNGPVESNVLSGTGNELVHPTHVDVDVRRSIAYVTDWSSSVGKVLVIDLNGLGAGDAPVIRASVRVPGANGVSVDQSTGRVYVGSVMGSHGFDSTGLLRDKLYEIDPSKIVANDYLVDPEVNDAAVVSTVTVTGANGRPGVDERTKKVFVGNSGSGTVTVVDMNPASPTYRSVIDTIQMEPNARPNSIEVDETRRLVYSANLTSKSVAVIDADTNQYLYGVPLQGTALEVDVDPATGTAYATNMRTNSTHGTGTVTAFNVTRIVDVPKGEAGAPGPVGATGAQGPAGPAVSVAPTGFVFAPRFTRLVLGSKAATVTVPKTGTVSVRLMRGRTVVATGSAKVRAARSTVVTYRMTAAGRRLLARHALRTTATVTYTTGTAANRQIQQRTAKVTIPKRAKQSRKHAAARAR